MILMSSENQYRDNIYNHNVRTTCWCQTLEAKSERDAESPELVLLSPPSSLSSPWDHGPWPYIILFPPTVATGAYHAYLSVVVGDLNACQPNNTSVKTPDFLSMTFNNSSNTLVLSLFSYRKKSTPKHLMPNLLSIEDYAFQLNIVIS